MDGVLLFVTGIIIFLTGLKFVADGVQTLSGKRTEKILRKAASNRFSSCVFGVFISALAQSGAAVNIAAVSLADSGALAFMNAAAMEIGSNVGTTVTAQLASLAGFTGGKIAPVLLLAVSFFAYVFFDGKDEFKAIVSKTVFGLSLVLSGVFLVSLSSPLLTELTLVKTLLTIKSPPILLLNGFFIAAFTSSSSALSAVLVIFAASGKVNFLSATYLIVGANIGSCVAVYLLSLRKGENARKTALFNFVFNLYGGVLYLVFLTLFHSRLALTHATGRSVAAFHTLFNVAAAAFALPVLKPLTKLCAFIVRADLDKKYKNLTGNSGKKVRIAK